VLRASPHKREEKERVRASLLKASLELAAAHGFSSLGLREVARAANIAPTSFYRHFADMGELGRALIDEHVQDLLASLGALIRTGDAQASAHALVQGLMTAVEAHPELVRFMIAERVGAFASLREALARKLAAFTLQLQLGASGNARRRAAHAAEMALALLLDGCARALDLAQPERSALRERLAVAIAIALGQETA
jgi:AcrR family transcriptional regulator